MAADGVLKITDANFEQEVLKSREPVLVDFWAEWCQPCRMLGPTMDELAKEFHGKVKVGKIEAEANRETSIKLGISKLPTVILFKDGQVVRTFIGLQPKKEFAAELQKASA